MTGAGSWEKIDAGRVGIIIKKNKKRKSINKLHIYYVRYELLASGGKQR